MIKTLTSLAADKRPLVRFTVLICVAALATLIVWLGVLRPFSLMALVPEQQTVIDQKRSEMLAARRSLNETASNLTPTDRRNLLLEITKKNLGETAPIDDQGTTYVVVSISAASASSVLSWLSGLETDAGIAPDEVDIQRADSTDAWNGVFRFPLGKGGDGV